jgi:hypothetical protein
VDPNRTHDFRKVYADIINGYSVVDSTEEIYVRHLNESDIGFISSKYKIHYKEAQSKGLLTTKEKIKLLKDQEIWSGEEDEEIKKLSLELERNNETKRNLIIKSQIDEVAALIAKQERELQSLESKKDEAVDLTCEKYADRKSNEEIVNLCLFKDREFKETIFTKEEYEEIDQTKLYAYIYIYNNTLVNFTAKFIKQLASLPFFMNSFLICNDDPMIFFGEPIINLTNYQIDLFSTGKYYKSVMSSIGSPPDEDYDDPDKLVDWYDKAKSTEEINKAMEGKEASTITGASKEEMNKIIKDDPFAVDLNKEVQKISKEKGKKVLSMEDVMKIHGHNAKF